jgi:hypothetical protein
VAISSDFEQLTAKTTDNPKREITTANFLINGNLRFYDHTWAYKFISGLDE